jgi:hypothetical protein
MVKLFFSWSSQLMPIPDKVFSCRPEISTTVITPEQTKSSTTQMGGMVKKAPTHQHTGKVDTHNDFDGLQKKNK